MLLYFSLFWLFAFIFVLLRTREIGDALPRNLLKIIPAILAADFVFTTAPAPLFTVFLAIFFVFCALGDFAIEYQLIAGLGFFLIAHIVLAGNFLYYGLAAVDLARAAGALVLCMSILVVYIVFYYRYLLTSKLEQPPALLKAVAVYAFILALSVSSCAIIWVSLGSPLGWMPFFGALFFLSSDSMIGVREFHHRFKYDRGAVLLTYYIAIFLLSTSMALIMV